MEGDDKNQAKAGVSVTIGKEIDAAFAEIVRGLFKGPAQELGNFLTDGIGFLLSDRMRKKRAQNLQLGLNETKELLDARSIDLTDVFPPSEEELYIVLEGMSLSGDECIRKLWAGLLAGALSDSDREGTGRPITSTISSLSPVDARIIAFAAYVIKAQTAFRNDAEMAAGVGTSHFRSLADSVRIEKAEESMTERLNEIYEYAATMKVEYGLDKVEAMPDWHHNLQRLGLISAKPDSYRSSVSPPSIRGRSIDASDLANLINYASKRADEAKTLAINGLDFDYIAKFSPASKGIRLGLEFKPFGHSFCKACGLL